MPSFIASVPVGVLEEEEEVEEEEEMVDGACAVFPPPLY
jgi:hypothetical protein